VQLKLLICFMMKVSAVLRYLAVIMNCNGIHSDNMDAVLLSSIVTVIMVIIVHDLLSLEPQNRNHVSACNWILCWNVGVNGKHSI